MLENNLHACKAKKKSFVNGDQMNQWVHDHKDRAVEKWPNEDITYRNVLEQAMLSYALHLFPMGISE